MSGIFGILNLDGKPLPHDALERMADAMAFRGLDGGGHWAQDAIGLGHLALHTTPEAAGQAQPHRDPTSGLVITADARLDDRAELCRRLRIDGVQGRGLADCQLLLQAYRRWGRECVDRLQGDYAFAIWDPVARRLFCARDPLGVKPFYFCHTAAVFAWASSAPAVLASGAVARRLNRGRVADLLVDPLECIDHESTFFADVHRLPPASQVEVCGRDVRRRRFWRPDPHRELRFPCDADYREAFGEVFTRSVADRMRCQAPVAASLSGGVDSATIVGAAREIARGAGGGPLATYSGVTADATESVEARCIRAVVAQGGVEAKLLPPAELAAHQAGLQRVLQAVEEPFDASMLLWMLLYGVAQSDGHRVMLDGVDGDLVTSLQGNYLLLLARRGRVTSAWREARAVRERHGGQDFTAREFARLLLTAATPAGIRRWRQRPRHRTRLAEALDDTLIAPRFAHEVSLAERFERFDAHSHSDLRGGPRQVAIAALVSPLLTAGVERYARVSALCGMAARHPYLDRRLVEFCASLPWNQRIRHGWTKYILRNLGERWLPSEVVWRKDWESLMWSFTEAWLRLQWREVRERLADHAERLSEFVKRGQITGLPGDPGRLEQPRQAQLWSAYSLLLWLERNDFP